MCGVVVRNINRADPDVISGLGSAGVATVHEAADQTGLLPPLIRPIQDGVSIAGSAVTVWCPPGDNMMIHAAVEVVRPGDVVMVAVKEPSTHGMFGELLATSFQARGCRGLIIDAAVRDVSELRKMQFPVWSRAVHARGTVKETAGSVNVPVIIGDQTVNPGDVVVADDDGVVVIERDRAGDVLESSRERLAREETVRKRLRNGELGVDFYGFRERLERLGVRWVEDV
ncbi:MAG TPA: 4-carboxy-4-hydroxy-2-oxoadipate aldolase/oxaloacetate decarboxylase [Acidimicrobiia bacterium]|nr:4-carboxy-4-hydroxy-2-oxoadipate aldolase/oxaloacetate decarboxylase [Acidimicrobiia bacterium]